MRRFLGFILFVTVNCAKTEEPDKTDKSVAISPELGLTSVVGSGREVQYTETAKTDRHVAISSPEVGLTSVVGSELEGQDTETAETDRHVATSSELGITSVVGSELEGQDTETAETDKSVAISPELGLTSVVGSELEGQDTETASPLSEPTLLGELSTPSDVLSVISAKEQCENQGEIWQDEKCKSLAQIDCDAQGNTWNDATRECMTASQVCIAQGNTWDERSSSCLTPELYCTQVEPNIWQFGSCKTLAEAQDECSALGLTWNSTTNVCPSFTLFTYTGTAQTFVVPPNLMSIKIRAYGAKGAEGQTNAIGGLGAGIRLESLNVTPGETLYVNVGGKGMRPASGYNNKGRGGTAWGGTPSVWYAGGGGGSSDIRRGSQDLVSRIIVAAGGGGGGYFGGGGAGGCSNGLTGFATLPGYSKGSGGTQTGAGTPGGSLGSGGSGTDAGGGGGAGYYGGGGGNWTGGGGGSSFIETPGDPRLNNADYCKPGVRSGNGEVRICWGDDTSCDTL